MSNSLRRTNHDTVSSDDVRDAPPPVSRTAGILDPLSHPGGIPHLTVRAGGLRIIGPPVLPLDGRPPMDPPPLDAPGANLMIRVEIFRADPDSGDLVLIVHLVQPGGAGRDAYLHETRLRGNRVDLQRRIVQDSRRHASVAPDCPVRLIWEVDG